LKQPHLFSAHYFFFIRDFISLTSKYVSEMKLRIFLLPVIFFFVFLVCNGQAPQAFKYQAAIRDETGMVISDQLVSLRVSVLKGDIYGEIVYIEIHDVYTNAIGIVNLEIGRGLALQGDFSQIGWGEDDYFVQLEIDMEGGMDYQSLGTSQLLSVPYALYAEKSGSTDTLITQWKESAGGIYYDEGNVGINTSVPDNSALLDMTSNAKGFLTPRMTQTDIELIPNPANGLVVFCTTDDKFYGFVESAETWKEILYGEGTIAPQNYCGSFITVEHAAGNVAPVTKTVTYGIVVNVPGEPLKCWITSNLGADHQATSMEDATEASAGWYWQFNRKQGYKHDGEIRTPNNAWIASISENLDWQAANDPCSIELGGDWRLPTYTEWNNVDEIEDWSDRSDPWNSALKLHCAGSIDISGFLIYRGSHGGFYSSNQNNNTYAWHIVYGPGYCGNIDTEKARAFNIRCLRDL
jgi:hypothetical protein